MWLILDRKHYRQKKENPIAGIHVHVQYAMRQRHIIGIFDFSQYVKQFENDRSEMEEPCEALFVTKLNWKNMTLVLHFLRELFLLKLKLGFDACSLVFEGTFSSEIELKVSLILPCAKCLKCQ